MNTQNLILAGGALILGLGGGYLIAEDNNANHGHDDDEMFNVMDSHMDDEMGSPHDDTFEVTAEEAPKVGLTVEEDAKSGWNVTLVTEDFKFTPENVNTDNVVGEGHAHLYVDGVKIARLYGPNFHYDGSFDGSKTFKVTLNANDHSEYAVDGEVITAETKVSHDDHN